MRLQTKEAQEFRLQQICHLYEDGFDQTEISERVNCIQAWECLKQMLTELYGKLLMIWDNASIDDCEKTRRFLETDEQAKRLHLVKQPTYSPEVKADEQVWNQLKSVGLKNTCY